MMGRLKKHIDSTDVFFGLLPAAAGYAAFVSWASLIVRAIRGEEVEEDWRVWVSTAALMASFVFVSGTRVRETAALRGAAIEMRELTRVAARDAETRDRRAAEQQDRLAALTKALIVLAALTLAAAVVTLVVSVVGA